MKLSVAALFLSISLIGCGSALKSVVDSLPTVIQYVQDAQLVLDRIDRLAQPVLEIRGDDKLDQQYEQAMTTARSALQVALRGAKGGQELSDQQLLTAFQEFKQAYVELKELLRQHNLASTDRLSASGQSEVQFDFEDPLAVGG